MKLLIKNVLFPLHELLKGHNTMSCLDELNRSQWYSHKKLYGLQSEKLKVLIARIYMDVPYYTRLFDSMMIKPDMIRSPEDLRKLPFLTKPVVRENLDALRSRTAKSLVKFSTGRSCGMRSQARPGRPRGP